MTEDTALPEVEAIEASAGAGDQQSTAAPADDQQGQHDKPEGEQKPERHPLEKELAKERRRISRLVEQREISRAVRKGTPLCLALLDIDNFKRINDEHGHATGDEVLRQIVSRVRRRLPPGHALYAVWGKGYVYRVGVRVRA